jgi:hypothetical protein
MTSSKKQSPKSIFDILIEHKTPFAVCSANPLGGIGDTDWFIIIKWRDYKERSVLYTSLKFKHENYFSHNVAEKTLTKQEVLEFNRIKNSLFRLAHRNYDGAVYELRSCSFKVEYQIKELQS